MNKISPAYEIEDLTHCYGEQNALHVSDLTIDRGTIMGLMGPNGSGKSTLLQLLAGIQRPTRGSVLYAGAPIVPFDDRVRNKITLLPQIPYLMKRSVGENILYGLRIRKDTSHHTQKIHEALDWVGLSATTYARRAWNELSGGEAQRVALAARLILRPEVLLMDEPISSVDAASAQRIKEAALRASHQWGTTLVIASHDAQWLFSICDEIRYLFNGSVLKSGMANIVFGPWQTRADGTWEKRLSSGMRFIAPKPPHENAAAVISPNALSLNIKQKNMHTEGTEIEGVISRLTLEKSTKNALVEVCVGDVSLSVVVSNKQLIHTHFYPGQSVVVTYAPSQIRWF